MSESVDSATYKIQSFRRELYGQTYRFIAVRSTNLEARKEHKLEDVLILMTDIRDDQSLSDKMVLRLYKDKNEVECRFRYLKSPYHVGPIFLQRPSRVKTFGYLMLMSLLLYSAFEYILREQMAQETEPLILPGKRKSFRPTGASVLEMFETMVSTWVSIDGRRQRVNANPADPQRERILGFFGLDMSIYSEAQKSA